MNPNEVNQIRRIVSDRLADAKYSTLDLVEYLGNAYVVVGVVCNPEADGVHYAVAGSSGLIQIAPERCLNLIERCCHG